MMIFILLFLVLVGVKFCSPDVGENEADKEIARNPFGCLLNMIGLVLGLGTCITAAIYYSIVESWWMFLLFFPALVLAGAIKVLLCKIIPLGKMNNPVMGPLVSRVVLKKGIGAFLVVVAYVLYFVLR